MALKKSLSTTDRSTTPTVELQQLVDNFALTVAGVQAMKFDVQSFSVNNPTQDGSLRITPIGDVNRNLHGVLIGNYMRLS